MVMKQTYLKDFMSLAAFDHKITACIGFFDGLHRGHQVLINETIRIAKETGTESALITFSPDPWTVINNKSKVNHITPIKDKVRIAEELGLDHFITVHFDSDTAKLSPQEFIEKVLLRINVKHLVVGADFRFGHKGAGDVTYLKEHASIFFDTHVLKIDKSDDDAKIGTTQITQAILKGDMETATNLLGRPYHLTGIVIPGKQEGRKIGFPTANIDVIDEYVIPSGGIYAGFIWVDGIRHEAVLNIGYNPTFNTNDYVSIESFILDFDEDIYGRHVKQNFIKRLRPELKFDSVESLVAQMKLDVLEARTVLKEYEDYANTN